MSLCERSLIDADEAMERQGYGVGVERLKSARWRVDVERQQKSRSFLWASLGNTVPSFYYSVLVVIMSPEWQSSDSESFRINS